MKCGILVSDEGPALHPGRYPQGRQDEERQGEGEEGGDGDEGDVRPHRQHRPRRVEALRRTGRHVYDAVVIHRRTDQPSSVPKLSTHELYLLYYIIINY